MPFEKANGMPISVLVRGTDEQAPEAGAMPIAHYAIQVNLPGRSRE